LVGECDPNELATALITWPSTLPGADTSKAPDRRAADDDELGGLDQHVQRPILERYPPMTPARR